VFPELATPLVELKKKYIYILSVFGVIAAGVGFQTMGISRCTRTWKSPEKSEPFKENLSFGVARSSGIGRVFH